MFRFARRAVTTFAKQHKTISVNINRCATVQQLPAVYTASFSTGRQKPFKKFSNLKSSGLLVKLSGSPWAWRFLKYSLVVLGIALVCTGGNLINQLGMLSDGDDKDKNVIEYSERSSSLLEQYLQQKPMKELDSYDGMIRRSAGDKLLPDPDSDQPPYTLVLELTGVLIHEGRIFATDQLGFQKRPGVDEFLETLDGRYEIVIYTAEQAVNAFPLLTEILDADKISYKLLLDTTQFNNGQHIKYLNRLNRDLKRVIVIDWNFQSVKYNPENLFQIARWNGNLDDGVLFDLTEFLKTIADYRVDDVREVIKYYSHFRYPLEEFKRRQRELKRLQEQEAEEQ